MSRFFYPSIEETSYREEGNVPGRVSFDTAKGGRITLAKKIGYPSFHTWGLNAFTFSGAIIKEEFRLLNQSVEMLASA